MSSLTPLLLLAQEDYHRPSMNLLQWMYYSLGPFYLLLLCGSGFLVFAGALAVVALSKRPAVIAAYLVFVPLPLLIGVFATFDGFISAFAVVATASAQPKPSEVAEGISTGLFSMWFGLGAMFPGYFVTSVGLFVRTLLGGKSA
jgi:hypothetical protein